MRSDVFFESTMLEVSSGVSAASAASTSFSALAFLFLLLLLLLLLHLFLLHFSALCWPFLTFQLGFDLWLEKLGFGHWLETPPFR